MVRGYASLLLACTGCYLEAGAGYFPTIKETVTTADGPQRSESSGFSAMFKLGFYLDIPIPPLRTAIGLGVTPSRLGGDAIVGSDTQANVTPTGLDKRLDLSLPFHWSRTFVTRVTLIHNSISHANVKMAPQDDYLDTEATGSTWYAGATVGTTLRNGNLFMLSAGLQRQHASTEAKMGSTGVLLPVEQRATGLAMRVTVAWTPTGALMKYYHPTPMAPQQRGNAGCHYVDKCDGGVCRTVYKCE